MRAELKSLRLPSGEAVRWGYPKPDRPRPPIAGDGPARDASPAKRDRDGGLVHPARRTGRRTQRLSSGTTDGSRRVRPGGRGEPGPRPGRGRHPRRPGVLAGTSPGASAASSSPRWSRRPSPRRCAGSSRRLAGASWPEIVERLRESWPESGERLRPTVRFVARFRTRGAATVVTPLDPDATSEYGHLLRDALYGLATSAHGLKVVLDLSQADYVPSSTLGIFDNFRKRLLERAGALRLCHLSARVREIFRVTRLDARFQIDPDEDRAIERLGERRGDPEPVTEGRRLAPRGTRRVRHGGAPRFWRPPEADGRPEGPGAVTMTRSPSPRWAARTGRIGRHSYGCQNATGRYAGRDGGF